MSVRVSPARAPAFELELLMTTYPFCFWKVHCIYTKFRTKLQIF